MLLTSQALSPRVGNPLSIKGALSIFLDSLPIGVAVEFPGLMNDTNCFNGVPNVVSDSAIQVNLSQLNSLMGFRTTRKTMNDKTYFTRKANKEGDIAAGLRKPEVILSEAKELLKRLAENTSFPSNIGVGPEEIYSAWSILNSLEIHYRHNGKGPEIVEKWDSALARNKLLTIKSSVAVCGRDNWADEVDWRNENAAARRLIAEYLKYASTEDISRMKLEIKDYLNPPKESIQPAIIETPAAHNPPSAEKPTFQEANKAISDLRVAQEMEEKHSKEWVNLGNQIKEAEAAFARDYPGRHINR